MMIELIHLPIAAAILLYGLLAMLWEQRVLARVRHAEHARAANEKTIDRMRRAIYQVRPSRTEEQVRREVERSLRTGTRIIDGRPVAPQQGVQLYLDGAIQDVRAAARIIDGRPVGLGAPVSLFHDLPPFFPVRMMDFCAEEQDSG